MKLRRALCGLAAAAFLAAAPVRAEIADSENVKTTEFDLPNGLHVILSEDHTLPLITVNMMYHVGSANEAKGHTGFAHLFEHLMFCGSAHVGKGQFPLLVKSVCGEFNGSTNNDYTEYYITVPSNNLPLALFLESDRLGYFIDRLRPGIVDEQRGVVLNELLEKNGNLYEDMRPFVYPDGHPYSWKTSGTVEDIQAASYADVVNFYQKYYVPGNASLAIVGDFDTAEAKKMAEHWFSDVPARPLPPQLNAAALAGFPEAVRKTMTDKKITRPERWLYWHTPALYQDGDSALELLSCILGVHSSARLRKLLMFDKQMVSDIWVKQESRELGSHFVIVFFPLPGHSLDEIQAVIDEELERISQEPPSQEEMNMALAVEDEMNDSSVNSIRNRAQTLNLCYWTAGRGGEINNFLERFRSVTPKEISSCAKRWLRPDRRLEITVLPESQKPAREMEQNAGGKIK